MSDYISVFDMLKIGVGPSSSHTLGPWRAAQDWVADLHELHVLPLVTHVRVDLYGSLAKTGVGHGTGFAVQMGLTGADPVTFDPMTLRPLLKTIKEQLTLRLNNQQDIVFNPDTDIRYLMAESLPFHANGMRFYAYADQNELNSAIYYSTGGGFIVCETKETGGAKAQPEVPYLTYSTTELQHACVDNGLNIFELVWANEVAFRTPEQIKNGLLLIWDTMRDCAFRGCHTDGILEGGLNVSRKAAGMYRDLLKGDTLRFEDSESWLAHLQSKRFSFFQMMQMLSCFAFAVNEENAAFGRVVTAPTNGAAGVIPSVLLFYTCLSGHATSKQDVVRFLTVAAHIGSYFKRHATISAAMGGCQAEIGVSSAMAAAALTECLGGSVGQALQAAEIAMEHHLGMTCDPIGGLVQIPCIERNSMGAIKAIMASTIALENDPLKARVSLDDVIATMWRTAQDMNSKYKETAEGGLAVLLPVSLVEC